jgi:hypothetical protein
MEQHDRRPASQNFVGNVRIVAGNLRHRQI